MADDTSPTSARRRARRRSRKPTDFWQDLLPDDTPVTVRPATDPTAAIRSLGSPPLPGQGASGDHYLALVAARAAGLATALAAAAALLEDQPEA